MCGFVGFTNHINNASNVLNCMMETIRHRGPDSEGKFIDEKIALGFRRLSIIDINGGNQPIFNEDKSVILLFNGEIYNFKELRTKLTDKGHTFSTNSDSEVIIHGYEEWNEDVIKKLRGMFSFIIWDKSKDLLFGGRDIFGIKPLYYSQMGETFMFSSEIKSLLCHPDFKKELNEDILETYLTFQYSPTSSTFFKNVYKLPPSSYFKYKAGKIEIKKYYEIKFEENNDKTLDEWVSEIQETFSESVSAHKISDVEVGSFLSSGVDSSYVSAVANVDKTFTVGFGNDEKYNEIKYAQDFSKFISKQNISKTITTQEYWDVIPKIQYHMDEPLADPAAVALYFVSKLASEHVKVVLSGEGADEIFGGYNIYKEAVDSSLYDIVPKFIRKRIGGLAESLPHKRGINFFIRKGKSLEERFIGNAFIFSEKERKEILKIKTDAPSPQEITKPFYKKVENADSVTKMQYIDLNLWLVGDILLKADKMSMANSIELRVPFLDKKVLDKGRTLPRKYRVNTKSTKYALRLAAQKNCPIETANKRKLGFPVPIRVWLKEDKYYEKVKDAFISETANKFFNTSKLIDLLNDHRLGRYDNSRKIWTVYCFIIWYNVFFK